MFEGGRGRGRGRFQGRGNGRGGGRGPYPKGGGYVREVGMSEVREEKMNEGNDENFGEKNVEEILVEMESNHEEKQREEGQRSFEDPIIQRADCEVDYKTPLSLGNMEMQGGKGKKENKRLRKMGKGVREPEEGELSDKEAGSNSNSFHILGNRNEEGEVGMEEDDLGPERDKDNERDEDFDGEGHELSENVEEEQKRKEEVKNHKEKKCKEINATPPRTSARKKLAEAGEDVGWGKSVPKKKK